MVERASAPPLPWRKVLYEEQVGYPDNYTDETFLTSVLTSIEVPPLDLLALAKDSSVVAQQLSVVAAFCVVYLHVYYGELSAELEAHLPIANGIMGLAKARAEILLVSAFDFPAYSWKENGWDAAYEKATALRAQVDAYLTELAADAAARAAAADAGENYAPEKELLPFDRWWSDFLRQNSEYWDPPLPATGKQPPAIGMKNFGAFNEEPMTRNDMKRAIGESEYEHFLANGALVDTIFFDMEPGTVAGPYRGPKGYYIVYLKGRTRPTNPLNMRTDRHQQMIQEDWVRKAFQSYAHAALAEAETQGL